MAFSYEEISTQLEKLSEIIERSRARSMHTESYNKSISQSKKTMKSVNYYDSPKSKAKSQVAAKPRKLSKPEKNPRLCPWVELDDQIKDFHQENLYGKPAKRKAKTAPPSLKKKALRKKQQNASIRSEQKEQSQDSRSLYSYSDSNVYSDYDPYYSYSDYSFGSDQEDFLISEIEGPIQKGLVRTFFRKWERRFFARISLLIQRELHNNENRAKQENEDQKKPKSKESPEKHADEEQESDDNKAQKNFTDVDSDQKEKLIDIIFNSSQ